MATSYGGVHTSSRRVHRLLEFGNRSRTSTSCFTPRRGVAQHTRVSHAVGCRTAQAERPCLEAVRGFVEGSDVGAVDGRGVECGGRDWGRRDGEIPPHDIRGSGLNISLSSLERSGGGGGGCGGGDHALLEARQM